MTSELHGTLDRGMFAQARTGSQRIASSPNLHLNDIALGLPYFETGIKTWFGSGAVESMSRTPSMTRAMASLFRTYNTHRIDSR